ncbi:MAG TPA: AraC family transcriptional regulator [Rhizomicrobium sp.]|nr:AraC family transcriptional regulator [Rhizomicrobium sp.]
MANVETLERDIPRHTHARAYAALVIGGGYEEAGDRGRFAARAGEVVLHECFEAHLDRVAPRGARVVNIALPADARIARGHGAVSDPDAVMTAPPAEAGALLLSLFEPAPAAARDWPDLLARDLIADPFLDLSCWGERARLPGWTLTRGFVRVFGIPPSSFRARARARRAWNAIRGTPAPLAAIAADCGFSDQAHMTRAVRALTSAPPTAWRCK